MAGTVGGGRNGRLREVNTFCHSREGTYTNPQEATVGPITTAQLPPCTSPQMKQRCICQPPLPSAQSMGAPPRRETHPEQGLTSRGPRGADLGVFLLSSPEVLFLFLGVRVGLASFYDQSWF